MSLDAILNGDPVWADQENPVDFNRFELMPAGTSRRYITSLQIPVVVTCLDHLGWERTVDSLASAIAAATQHHTEMHRRA